MIALTRNVGNLDRCELTYRSRLPIDAALAREQHRQYERLLQELGVEVVSLAAEPDLPDAVFVEDAAIVLEECALLTHMGAPSRRPESASLAAALAAYRDLVHLPPPGTLDGGDVLLLGRTLFVGLSTRTNQEGIAALRERVEPLGYTVRPVPVRDCLHLKSACSDIGRGALLVNPAWVDGALFPGFDRIAIAPEEPEAANVLRVGDTIVASARFPRTAARLAAHGLSVRTLDNSEFLKAEGGLTCTSLLFAPSPSQGAPPRDIRA